MYGTCCTLVEQFEIVEKCFDNIPNSFQSVCLKFYNILLFLMFKFLEKCLQLHALNLTLKT